jgi:hypothetical protein
VKLEKCTLIGLDIDWAKEFYESSNLKAFRYFLNFAHDK